MLTMSKIKIKVEFSRISTTY